MSFKSVFVISLAFFSLTRVLFIGSTASAQNSGEAFRGSTSGSMNSARPTSSGRRLVSQTMPEQESALRTIAIAPLTLAQPSAAPDSDALVKAIVQQLLAKSYLEPKATTQAVTSKSSATDLQRAATADGVDGILLSEARGAGIVVRVISGRSGRTLASVAIPLDDIVEPATLKNPKMREQIAAQIADRLIETFPYRGFVTVAGDRLVKINLGSRHGMQPGLRMRVFEFTGSSFKSERKDLGEIEVTKVLGPNESIAAELHSHGLIRPFAKIGFDEKVVTSVADTRGPNRGWIFVGGEDMNMDATASAAQYADRTYKMSETPFVAVGLGIKKFSLDMRYGQARNNDYDVTYTEIVALYKLYEHLRGPWDLGFWAGGRVGAFNVTTASTTTGTLPSSTGVSPAFAGSVSYHPDSSFTLFAQGDLYYPVLYSGQATSFLPYSISGGLTAGMRVMLSQAFGVQLGARIKSFRRAVDGLSSVQERQTSFFGGLVVAF